MRRIDFIPNVSQFSVNECNLAIVKSDFTALQIYDHDGKIESQFLSTKKLQSLSSCKKLFWANETEENISIFYDGKRFSNYNFNIRVVSNDLSYFIGVRDNISHRVALDGSIKWSLNDKIVNFYMDDVKIYYITRKRYVIAIDVDSGEKLWENYLGEAFDWIEKDFYNQLVNRKVSITKIIGEQNGKLWLLLSSKNILCLNSDSGQNIFYFNTSFLYPDKWVDIERRDRYLFSIYSKLDKKNGVLYDLTATTYTEIDTRGVASI